jgi:hypothetical protein
MREEIKKFAGISEGRLPEKKDSNLKKDLMKSRAGLINEDGSDIKEKDVIEKLYINLLNEFKDDTENINKIKDIFNEVVK